MIVAGHLASQLEEPTQPGIADRVNDLTPSPLCRNETAPAQAGKVVGNPALRYTELGDQLRHTARAHQHEPDDRKPRRIAECAEETRIPGAGCRTLLDSPAHTRLSERSTHARMLFDNLRSWKVTGRYLVLALRDGMGLGRG